MISNFAKKYEYAWVSILLVIKLMHFKLVVSANHGHGCAVMVGLFCPFHRWGENLHGHRAAVLLEILSTALNSFLHMFHNLFYVLLSSASRVINSNVYHSGKTEKMMERKAELYLRNICNKKIKTEIHKHSNCETTTLCQEIDVSLTL